MNTLVALLAVALTGAVGASTAVANEVTPYTEQLGKRINDYRTAHGLQPLTFAAPLSQLAQEHARRMAREGRLSHDGFNERFAKAHAPHCVENVGGGYAAPGAEFDAWRQSPIHDRNLLDPTITYMGLWIEGRYVAFFACG